MNQLQAMALSEELRCKKRLWREGGLERLKLVSVSSVGEATATRSVGSCWTD